MKPNTLRSVMGIGATIISAALAQDHYAPGVANIRDWTVPDPGLYGALYNYALVTNSLNDANGNPISSVTITGPNGGSATLRVGVNLNVYVLAPMFIWVPKMPKILGARYGGFIMPSFTNASLGLVSGEIGAGVSPTAGQFNAGDLFVQPVWLDWGGHHYDITYGYGFYIPSGKIRSCDCDSAGDWRHEGRLAEQYRTGLLGKPKSWSFLLLSLGR